MTEQLQEQKVVKEVYKEGMINIPIEEMLDKSGGSTFKLCNIASKRALELSEGAHKLIDGVFPKITTLALEEIRQNKVRLKKKEKQESE